MNKEMLNREISDSSGLSFRRTNMIPLDDSMGPVMHYPYDKVYPKAYEATGKGTVRFHLYLPNAHKVVLRTLTDEYELYGENGRWKGEFFVGVGFVVIFIIVDGSDMLYPALPIGFGGNRPINYIELGEEENREEPVRCSHGTISMDYFNSKVTGKLERIYVYLPPDYYTLSDEVRQSEGHALRCAPGYTLPDEVRQSEGHVLRCAPGYTLPDEVRQPEGHVLRKKYPVLYLQHGHGENETAWVNQGKVNFILDKLISEKRAEPMIVVMCNGMVSYEQDEEIFVGAVEEFEEFLTTEVIPYVERKYRSFGDKAHRGMAGLSMGSMQTSVITLKHQDLFDYAGIFSGFVRDVLSGYEKHVQAEYLNTYGENIKYIFRAIGNQDIFLPYFHDDDRLLEEYHVEHERVIYSGAHEWMVWQRCIYDFAQRIFK